MRGFSPLQALTPVDHAPLSNRAVYTQGRSSSTGSSFHDPTSTTRSRESTASTGLCVSRFAGGEYAPHWGNEFNYEFMISMAKGANARYSAFNALADMELSFS